MSIKLLNGLRLKREHEDLFSVVPTIAEAIREELFEAAKSLVGEELARAADNPTVRNRLKPGSLLWFEVEEDWRAHQAELGPHHRLNDPLRFSIIFGRSAGGRVLSYYYAEHEGYRDALTATKLFEEYRYWNNSDRPKKLTKKQWDKRKREWDSLLFETGAFNSHPAWSLDSESDPWRLLFLRDIDAQDLNSYRSPEARRESALSAKIFEELQRGEDSSNLMRNFSKARRIAEAYLSSDGKDLELPEPLPKSFVCKTEELPPLYTVPSELILELVARGEPTL